MLPQDLRRLHQLGFSLIWLHDKSKRPIDTGWTSMPRKTLEDLEAQYREGLNVGVRTGRTSKLANGYLACIDVDVKDADYREEAIAVAEEILGFTTAPQVRSGSGHGSRHYYVATREPFKMVTVAKKPGLYEVCIYSDGRQMVLPPSIHPDTGKRYVWFEAVGKQLPVIDVCAYQGNSEKDVKVDSGTLDLDSLPLVEVDWLPLPDKIRKGILQGKGVEDRSAFLLPAATALLSIGLSKNEILSVLTDPKTYLGTCAYDHAKTRSRKVAARWVWRYTLQKIMAERESSKAFLGAAEIKETQLSEEDAAVQAEDLEDWQQKLDKTKDGHLRCTQKNVELLLSNTVHKEIFRRNEFNARIVYGANPPWKGKINESVREDDAVEIKNWFAHTHGIEPSVNLIWEGIIIVARKNAFHPVRELIDSVKWDGVERIDNALREYMGAEMREPYLSAISRKFFCAAVARIFSPGVKFDHMLVFENRTQGIGKSTAIEILASEPWFLDSLPNIRDKDAMLALQGTWFVEIAELAVLKRADAESYKAFFSSKVDKFRVPYGKHWEDEPRQCVFVGTTNNEDYLSDPTGNRRFWPCRVRQCAFKKLREDRLQLFAEAKVKWLAGEKLYLEGRALEQAKHIQASRVVDDEESVMRDELIEFEKTQLLKPKKERFGFDKFKIVDLFGLQGPFSNLKKDSFHLRLAGRVLRTQFFIKYGSKGQNFWRKRGIPRPKTGRPFRVTLKINDF
jgi:predicted P-loop ATPase